MGLHGVVRAAHGRILASPSWAAVLNGDLVVHDLGRSAAVQLEARLAEGM